jgi:sulfotransferase family protein
VGGAPRSGTHILAYLVGAHPSYYTIPYEVVVHCDRNRGIAGYIEGNIGKQELIEGMRGYWWRRPLPWNSQLERGIFKLIEQDELEAVLEAFEAAPDEDRLAGGRALARGLFERVTSRSPLPGWSEHTPWNVNSAPQLLALFPEAKFIHVVRDGRDRACSAVSLPWGAESYSLAVKRWGLFLRRAEAASQQIPRDRVLVVQLEDLVVFDRERSYERVLEFLDLQDDPAMHSFFESEIGPERAHVGRWRAELDDAEREEIEAAYRETLAELRADGVSSAPPDRTLEVAHGPSEARSSVDPWADGPGNEDI